MLAAGFVCWFNAQREPAERVAGPVWLTSTLLLLALGALSVGTLLWSPWLGAVAAAIALLGVANWVGGLPLLRAWMPGWLILLTSLPLPLGFDDRLLARMQASLISLARPLLGRYEVLHVVRADNIEVPGRVVPLGDACMGLYLIPAAMALALVLTTLFRRGWIHGFVVAATMPCWAFLGAFGWLVGGLKLSAGGGFDLFGGVGAAGMILLLLVVLAGLALSMDQFVMFWIAPSRASTRGTPLPESAPKPRLVAGSRLGWATAVAFALLGLAQTGLATRSYLNAPTASVVAPLATRAVMALPPELGGWRQFTNRFSAMDDLVTPSAGAQTWQYARGEVGASITLEQPLTGFQDLISSYLAAGWHVVRMVGTGQNSPGGAFVTAELQKDIFQYARVWFAVGDFSGHWLTPPRPLSRAERLGNPPAPASQQTFRVQLFVGTLEPLEGAEAESAEALFQAIRQQIAAQLTGQPTIPNAPANPQ